MQFRGAVGRVGMYIAGFVAVANLSLIYLALPGSIAPFTAGLSNKSGSSASIL